VEMSNKVLGQVHPDTLAIMAGLVSTWKSQGRLEEKCIQLREQIIGPDHSHTKFSVNTINQWQKEGSTFRL
jgi:hypothetical protein